MFSACTRDPWEHVSNTNCPNRSVKFSTSKKREEGFVEDVTEVNDFSMGFNTQKQSGKTYAWESKFLEENSSVYTEQRLNNNNSNNNINKVQNHGL